MNYLAHLFFADPTPESRVGHLMGDFYRGRLGAELSAAVAEGVWLHRRIDSYTDAHPRVTAARARMNGPRRRVAGIILDVAFDHFLCRHWDRFHRQTLTQFLQAVYVDLAAYQGFVPERMVVPLDRICQQQWLSVYGSVEGAGQALARMAGRFSRPTGLAQGGLEITRHYTALEQDFLLFFPQLMEYVEAQRNAYRQLGTDTQKPA